MQTVIANRFRLSEECFTPSFGEARLGYDVVQEQRVCVWLVPFRRRHLASHFMREVLSHAQMARECVPCVRAVGIDERTRVCYVAMDVISGRPLSEMPPTTIAEVARTGIAIMACVAGLHGIGQVHGRLCPSNVLHSVGGMQLFGLDLHGIQLVSEVNAYDRGYLSQEQLAGKEPGASCDWHAVAKCIQWLVGRVPPEANAIAVLQLESEVSNVLASDPRSRAEKMAAVRGRLEALNHDA